MKKRTTATSIDEYVALYPPDVQARLEKIRATIRKAAPQAIERISYQIPTFSQCGNLVHFAAYEHHIGFYPGASAVKHFRKEIAAYDSAKGSVQLPLNRPIPFGLITRVVKFRLKENLAKYASPAAKRSKKTPDKKKKKKSAT
jgi:uncharacterized protein YdhG (YjbR/CyaY superfamily)